MACIALIPTFKASANDAVSCDRVASFAVLSMFLVGGFASLSPFRPFTDTRAKAG